MDNQHTLIEYDGKDTCNKKVIYDIGSNNGDDIPYYLMKCDRVVAVEANPLLSDVIKSRFAEEINNGKVVVESCVITDNPDLGEVNFYIHKHNHVLSQFPSPLSDQLTEFDVVKLPSASILDIINRHGTPYYIKMDVEHYEVPLLKTLFTNNIRPPYISAESHSWEVFETIVNKGGYKRLKLVTGWSVCDVYKNRLIEHHITKNFMPYSFPHHSSGPFGNDVDGNWLNIIDFCNLLLAENVGWKDIHATNIEI